MHFIMSPSTRTVGEVALGLWKSEETSGSGRLGAHSHRYKVISKAVQEGCPGVGLLSFRWREANETIGDTIGDTISAEKSVSVGAA